MKYYFSFISFIFILCGVTNMAHGKMENLCYNNCYNKSKGVYSLFDKYGISNDCLYNNSEVENANKKIINKIKFDLSIINNDKKVYANVYVKNVGDKIIYIWRGGFPPYGGELSHDFFNIVTKQTKMDYLGVQVNFGRMPETPEDYIVIMPGEELKERIELNKYYQFLPGEHEYDIGTVSIMFTYNPILGSDDYPEDEIFWVRSNRIKITINGSEVKDDIVQAYNVK